MKKRLFPTIFLSLILIICSLFGEAKQVFAKTQLKSQNVKLSNNNLTKINNVINKALSSEYETMKTWKFTTSENIIKDSKLLELVDKSNKLGIEWYKKTGLKIKNYESQVKIDNVIKKSKTKYIVNVSYSVKFKVINSSVVSQSNNEKYKIELKLHKNNWYITKLLDLNMDDNIINTEKVQSKKSYSKKSFDNVNNTEFNNYNDVINSKISNINDISNNIDKYYQNLKIIADTNNTISRSYSGYNSAGAVRYAYEYGLKNNPKYTYFDGKDCTNFVSQCVFEGGGIPSRILPPSWTPAYRNNMIISTAWTTVNGFFNYMTKMGYASIPEDGCKTARLGDVLQFYNPASKDWTHSVILTKIDNTGAYYTAHSNHRIDFPVWEVFRKGYFSNLRLIKYWH